MFLSFQFKPVYLIMNSCFKPLLYVLGIEENRTSLRRLIRYCISWVLILKVSKHEGLMQCIQKWNVTKYHILLLMIFPVQCLLSIFWWFYNLKIAFNVKYNYLFGTVYLLVINIWSPIKAKYKMENKCCRRKTEYSWYNWYRKRCIGAV